MQNNADYLSDIYRGAKMGARAVESLIDKAEDVEMKKELLREQKKYGEFERKAEQVLSRHGVTPKPIGTMQEMMTKIGVKMNTAIDSSSSHIADILIQGNNMGVIGVTKTMNRHDGEQPHHDIDALAEEFVRMQEDNIERLKSFL